MALFLLSKRPHTDSSAASTQENKLISTVSISGQTITVEIAATHEAIQNGLAGHRPLKAFEGMLFVFDHSAIFKFWMRGMKFPLDIIWIDEKMRVVDITKNVPPLPFYAKALFYSPSAEARYVLEVTAGFCDTHGIAPGALASFANIPL